MTASVFLKSVSAHTRRSLREKTHHQTPPHLQEDSASLLSCSPAHRSSPLVLDRGVKGQRGGLAEERAVEPWKDDENVLENALLCQDDGDDGKRLVTAGLLELSSQDRFPRNGEE